MARPGGPETARFFVGILAADPAALALAGERLVAEFGPADLGAPLRPFTSTEYYRKELGPSPVRAFLAFSGPFHPGELAARKLATNSLEEELAAKLARDLPRPVNLDPGYLTPAKLVLASAKNFAHRIYLRDGIYAEVTLLYGKGGFRALPWTFPDYASGDYDGFFLEVRKGIVGP